MKYLKIFERFTKITPEEIEDYFLEYTSDSTSQIELLTFYDQKSLKYQFTRKSDFRYYLYRDSVKIEKFSLSDYRINDNLLGETYIYLEVNHPKDRCKGGLDLNGYTRDTIQYILRKFVSYTKYNVDISIVINETNQWMDPLSTSIVRIEFLSEK